MNDLMSLLRDRHSSRALFDPNRVIAKDYLHKILEAASWAPTAHNMQNYEVVMVDDRKLIEAIADIKAPVSRTFVKETYWQFSFSEEELRRKKTGVLATMFPAAWRNPGVKKSELAADDSISFMQQEIRSASVFGIVLYDPKRRAPASKRDFLGIVSLGCVMENMWLMASSLGIDFQVVSALSNGPMEKGIKRLLEIPKKIRVAYSFRLGYAINNPKYLRVRRHVDDFTHHNRYGEKGIVTDQEGFIHKAEAQNAYAENEKEGKWMEYLDADWNVITDAAAATYYRLIVYRAGKPYGIVRGYYMNGVLRFEIPYTDGKRNGIEKIYYENGKVEYEVPYIDGKETGLEREYYENGQFKHETYFKDNEPLSNKELDKNENEIL